MFDEKNQFQKSYEKVPLRDNTYCTIPTYLPTYRFLKPTLFSFSQAQEQKAPSDDVTSEAVEVEELNVKEKLVPAAPDIPKVQDKHVGIENIREDSQGGDSDLKA